MERVPKATQVSVPPRFVLALLGALLFGVQCFTQTRSASSTPQNERGVLLEQLSWDEAERILTPDRIVVIPLGAESKEHGRHLQLNNDWVMAEYLKQRVLAAAPVVIAPTINYSYFPAFLEYPGSTSLKNETARDMVVDICHSLASYGPRRFYILNTGISTMRPLSEAVKALASEGVTLKYFEWDEIDAVVKKVQQEAGGSHADEIETSMMLYIAPNTVRMSRAVKDLSPDRPGPFTRNPKATERTYSPTGAWGDPTLATKEKGQILVEATVKAILSDIEDLQKPTERPQLQPQWTILRNSLAAHRCGKKKETAASETPLRALRTSTHISHISGNPTSQAIRLWNQRLRACRLRHADCF